MNILATITYLIYVLIWDGRIIGGCAYLVFWRGESGCWFLLAVVLSSAALKPKDWRKLCQEEDGGDL